MFHSSLRLYEIDYRDDFALLCASNQAFTLLFHYLLSKPALCYSSWVASADYAYTLQKYLFVWHHPGLFSLWVSVEKNTEQTSEEVLCCGVGNDRDSINDNARAAMMSEYMCKSFSTALCVCSFSEAKSLNSCSISTQKPHIYQPSQCSLISLCLWIVMAFEYAWSHSHFFKHYDTYLHLIDNTSIVLWTVSCSKKHYFLATT